MENVKENKMGSMPVGKLLHNLPCGNGVHLVRLFYDIQNTKKF